jgi:RNA polymerase sigma-70 factor (ECF subfamily)
MKGFGGIERTDAELLRQALDHPEPMERRSAASSLLERYQDRVYVWCFRMVREHERACDMAQEVLINAYRKLDTFEGRSEFSSWLFTIARNRCLSELRRPSILETDGEMPDVADPSPSPERVLMEKMDEGAILDLLRERLEPIEQDVLWLRCFEGVPVDEITRMLRIETASGARGLLQRARRKLRAAMASNEEKNR